MCLVTDVCREIADYGLVRDIPSLCRHGQRQVLADEPRNQARLVPAHAVFQAECLRVHGSELRVVAATALRDIVKHPGEVSDLRRRQPLHDLRAAGELVVIPRQRESAQVTDHEQRMGIDGIGVEQVVLHASHDAPERRHVATQHTVEVHAP